MGSALGSTRARARIPMEDQKIRKYLFYLGILSRRNFFARLEYNKKIIKKRVEARKKIIENIFQTRNIL